MARSGAPEAQLSRECRRDAQPLGAEEESNGEESSFRGEPRSGALR